MNIGYRGKTTSLSVSVIPSLAEPLILGMDFLEKRNCQISLDGVAISRPRIEPTMDYIHCMTTREFLPHEENNELRALLEVHRQRFNEVTGLCVLAKHTIRLKHKEPLKQRYTPRNPAMMEVINNEVNQLLADGRIEPSRSPYSAPIVLARKKHGGWRMCIDYRQLNKAREPDAYPLPQINFILDQLKEAKFISSLDLKNGYWQIPLDESSRPYTAFTVPGRGLFQWRVMPFGLHSAPATFQRALDSIIGADLQPLVFVYLDDIIILGRTFAEHLSTLDIVFRRLQAAQMLINFEKCGIWDMW